MQLYYMLDLKDDPALIAEYERWHQPGQIWPDTVASIRDAGIHDMAIYRAGNRLVMVMSVADDFSPDAKADADAANPRVQEWEAMMDQFQQSLPFARPGEKWVRARRMFSLASL